jgi:hypothetical protein
MRRWMIVAVVLAVAGITLSWMSDRGPVSPAAARVVPTVRTIPAADPAKRDGVEDARQAGVDAVSATGHVLRAGPLTRRDLIGAFATAQFADELTSRTNDQARSFQLGTGLDTAVVLEVPLTATAKLAADETVMVSVWSVFMIDIGPEQSFRQVWRTTVMSMRFEKNRWRVGSWSSTPGPTPTPALDPGGYASFKDASMVTSWPTVGVR